MTKLDSICECGDPWSIHQKERYEGGCDKGTCLEDDCYCEQFRKKKEPKFVAINIKDGVVKSRKKTRIRYCKSCTEKKYNPKPCNLNCKCECHL